MSGSESEKPNDDNTGTSYATPLFLSGAGKSNTAIALIKALADTAHERGETKGGKTRQERVARSHIAILQDLSKLGIDPNLFDLMLSNELDRTLKKQFGIAFFIATMFFTLGSYAIIILNAALKWGISDLAVTALIVETPIQFIGLLYIIARNLFPQRQPSAYLDEKATKM